MRLEAIAEQMHLPPRQLQRALRASSTSFRALLDDGRRTLAPALLMQASTNVEQVGFRLGYAEPTAFIRAFKKWYGATPGEFRKRKGTEDAGGG